MNQLLLEGNSDFLYRKNYFKKTKYEIVTN